MIFEIGVLQLQAGVSKLNNTSDVIGWECGIVRRAYRTLLVTLNDMEWCQSILRDSSNFPRSGVRLLASAEREK